ncbi:MAG TPA: hypothetical protein VFI68_00975 [Anaerolineales bacterium]|nr:hypothetical protein [Anaerolineales bacterium]
MNRKTRLTISIISAIVLLACACPVSSLPAIGTPPATNAPVIPTAQLQNPTAAQQNANILYTDDFSSASSELESFSDESGSGETKDGVYVLRSTSDVWNWGQSDSEFGNTVIEFDTTITVGPANNNAGAGVICRMVVREDKSIDGYLLAISGDGFYSIRSITSSSMDPLVDWTLSDIVNQGNQVNKIRATCNGSELILEVNGKILATANATASGPQSGKFAFAAISFETDEQVAEVHFDNLTISEP